MLALQDIVKKDETLDDQTPIELVNNMTVAQVRGLQEFVLHNEEIQRRMEDVFRQK